MSLLRASFLYAVLGVSALSLGCGDASRSPDGQAAPNVGASSPAPPGSAASAPATVEPRETLQQSTEAGGSAGTPASDRASSLVDRKAGAAEGAPPSKAEPPRMREVTVPAGTRLTVRLANDVSSDESAVEDAVRGDVTKPVVVEGVTVVPEGADVRGTVLAAARSGRVKGRASVAFRFDSLTVHGSRYDVQTDRISRVAPATKGADAKKVGIGAGAGALIGAIAGGKKGMAIGGAVGAGGGTGVVLATRGREVRLPTGSVVTMRLTSPVTVQVPERE